MADYVTGMKPRGGRPPPEALLFMSPLLWPIGLAIFVRSLLWFSLPTGLFASDEEIYFNVCIALLRDGTPDPFWPPVTGWLIAAAAWLLRTTDARWLRLTWVAMDVACVCILQRLARHAAREAFGAGARADSVTRLATVTYALYLPAIAFAQFTTSETPSLLLTLSVLTLLLTARPSLPRSAAAGLLTGTLSLTRASLLPLVAILPAALLVRQRNRPTVRRAIAFVVVAGIVVVAGVLRTWHIAGIPTISTNSAYNLYLGNQDFYAEDLNLFRPRATAEQVEYRRQFFSGELSDPTGSPQELQREATLWITAHPVEFLRRAVGRLARVFAPKTDVLELVGGERRGNIFSPISLALLTVANLQWTVVLFLGLAGIAWLCRWAPTTGWMFAATVFGSLLLCLIAIAKPRYAFVVEPLLIIGAAIVIGAPRETLPGLGWKAGAIVVLLSAFVLWGWTAWLIFAMSSRLALAHVS